MTYLSVRVRLPSVRGPTLKNMDVLSEVLKLIKLKGAIFLNGEFSSPWSFSSPPSCELTPQLSPGAGKLVIYHLLTEGSGYVWVDEKQPMLLKAGDLVILPHGNSHVIGNGKRIKPIDSGKEVEKILAQKLRILSGGGGGDVTRFVCGYLAFESQLSDVLLGCLPPVMKVHIRSDVRGQWLENSIKFAVNETAAANPGSDAMLARLSEVLFVETLRRYIDDLPKEQTGWLSGVRDSEVGRTLALMHRDPAREWTIADLAKEVGTSRSVLAERFRHYLGEPPMSYLTRWRLMLATSLLTSSNASVAEIASEVGYESEPAFNRAFKREFGLPPARFRTESLTRGTSRIDYRTSVRI
jgi:AraC-like DNA-binding protein